MARFFSTILQIDPLGLNFEEDFVHKVMRKEKKFSATAEEEARRKAWGEGFTDSIKETSKVAVNLTLDGLKEGWNVARDAGTVLALSNGGTGSYEFGGEALARDPAVRTPASGLGQALVAQDKEALTKIGLNTITFGGYGLGEGIRDYMEGKISSQELGGKSVAQGFNWLLTYAGAKTAAKSAGGSVAQVDDGTAVSTRTPVGRRGSPMDVSGNTPTTINGRKYTGHALDRMQGRGATPTVVGNAIKNGKRSPGRKKSTVVHNTEGVSVVTNSKGDVVTVIVRSE